MVVLPERRYKQLEALELKNKSQAEGGQAKFLNTGHVEGQVNHFDFGENGRVIIRPNGALSASNPAKKNKSDSSPPPPPKPSYPMPLPLSLPQSEAGDASEATSQDAGQEASEAGQEASEAGQFTSSPTAVWSPKSMPSTPESAYPPVLRRQFDTAFDFDLGDDNTYNEVDLSRLYDINNNNVEDRMSAADAEAGPDRPMPLELVDAATNPMPNLRRETQTQTEPFQRLAREGEEKAVQTDPRRLPKPPRTSTVAQQTNPALVLTRTGRVVQPAAAAVDEEPIVVDQPPPPPQQQQLQEENPAADQTPPPPPPQQQEQQQQQQEESNFGPEKMKKQSRMHRSVRFPIGRRQFARIPRNRTTDADFSSTLRGLIKDKVSNITGDPKRVPLLRSQTKTGRMVEKQKKTKSDMQFVTPVVVSVPQRGDYEEIADRMVAQKAKSLTAAEEEKKKKKKMNGKNPREERKEEWEDIAEDLVGEQVANLTRERREKRKRGSDLNEPLVSNIKKTKKREPRRKKTNVLKRPRDDDSETGEDEPGKKTLLLSWKKEKQPKKKKDDDDDDDFGVYT